MAKTKKKRKSTGSGLEVKGQNIRISLAGPADQESRVRGDLDWQIYRRLIDDDHGCPAYLNDSGVAAKYATQIAQAVPYQAWKNPKKKDVVISIKSLDVKYRNPPYRWKWWISVRDDDEARVNAGDAAPAP